MARGYAGVTEPGWYTSCTERERNQNSLQTDTPDDYGADH
jgi:hypothetical protein